MGAPAAPTNVVATRVNDTTANIVWTNNSTSGNPWTLFTITRADDDGGWVQIARFTGLTYDGYVDSTVSANHFYRYNVYATNTTGDSAVVTSNYIYMTPAAPTGLIANKTAEATVALAWTDASNTSTGFTMYRSTTSALGTSIGTTGDGETTFSDTSAPVGQTLYYRVKATNGALASVESAYAMVAATQAPAAPTVLTVLPTFSLVGDTIRVYWQHNSLDGSVQSTAHVLYRVYDVGGYINHAADVSGTTAYYDIPITGIAAGYQVLFSVKTKGLHANYSAYSAEIDTWLTTQPQCNITTPATDEADVTGLPLTVAWSYTDQIIQAGWTLALQEEAEIMYFIPEEPVPMDINACVVTGTTETSYLIPSQYLESGKRYKLILTVRSGSGYTGDTTRTFVAAYNPPTVPVVSALFDTDTLATTISASLEVQGDNPATSYLALYRTDTYDSVSETVELLNPLTANSNFYDYTPRLGQNVSYRVMAVDASGGWSYTDSVVDTTPVNSASAFNFGAGFALSCVLSDEADINLNATNDSKTMAFPGRADKVLFEGEHVFYAPSFSAVIRDDAAKELDAYRLQTYGGSKIVFRDPLGYRCNAVADVNIKRSTGARKISVDISMGKVE